MLTVPPRQPLMPFLTTKEATPPPRTPPGRKDPPKHPMAFYLKEEHGGKDADAFPNSAIDSNIDESLKQMKAAARDLDEDYEYEADPANTKNRLFNDDDTLLFARSLKSSHNVINKDRLTMVIHDVLHQLSWPRFVEIGLEEALSKKLKAKLRTLDANSITQQTYENGWYNEAEREIKVRIEEVSKQQPAESSSGLASSSRRLRYNEAEETMFRHWMIQGKRRNYIFNAYRKTRSKESIIHKMKSVRKQFSHPNPVEGREHIKHYVENEKGHFSPNASNYFEPGPIPDADLAAFQDRINELIKTRTLLNLANEDDEEDPFRADATAIDLNLLRNYVLMSNRVLNEFGKVEQHVLTADESWVEAAQTVRRARSLVENALNLTKNRAGHELDNTISAADLTNLLGEVPQEMPQEMNDAEALASIIEPSMKRRRQ